MAADWQHLASAVALVTALDLDGTLVPFAATPQEAKMTPATEALLDSLIALPGVTCGIVTGRPRELTEPIAAPGDFKRARGSKRCRACRNSTRSKSR
jgi:hypothetical protein